MAISKAEGRDDKMHNGGMLRDRNLIPLSHQYQHALALCVPIERALNIQFLDKTVYYISDLPSDLQSGDVITVALIALFLALAATIYPSWRAARVNPAEALRYE